MIGLGLLLQRQQADICGAAACIQKGVGVASRQMRAESVGESLHDAPDETAVGGFVVVRDHCPALLAISTSQRAKAGGVASRSLLLIMVAPCPFFRGRTTAFGSSNVIGYSGKSVGSIPQM